MVIAEIDPGRGKEAADGIGGPAFSKSMARELARHGITVNSVCPGPADTPMTAAIRATEMGERMFQKLAGRDAAEAPRGAG